MFALSKIIWFIINPANLLLILAVLGVILLQIRTRRRLGMVFLSLFLVSALAVAVFPFGKAIYHHLEQRFPAPLALPAQVDGIIVLGGIVDPIVTAERGQEAIGGAFERILASARLADQYPNAQIVFSGGSGSLSNQEYKEAPLVEKLYSDLGVPVDRIVFESESRNTFENAARSKELISPKSDQTWVLVTSAFHMPRSVGVFRKAGWQVIPYPVDYSLRKTFDFALGFDFLGGLNWANRALHEAVGLAAYFILKRTSALYPAPKAP